MNFSKKRKRSSAIGRSVAATSCLLVFASPATANMNNEISSLVKYHQLMGRKNGALAFAPSYVHPRIRATSARDILKLFNNNVNGENKIGSTDKYLLQINEGPNQQENMGRVFNGNVNGDNFTVNGLKKERDQESSSNVDDDDYAMSVPQPLKSDDSLISSEEQPATGNLTLLSEEKLLESEGAENATAAIFSQNDSSVDQQAFIATLISNFWAKDTKYSDEEEDRAEESRRWSEWMTTGKKVRPSISTDKKASEDPPAAVTEKISLTDNIEFSEAANNPADATEQTKSPTKMLAKFKVQVAKKKTEMDQQQQQRRQELAEKQQIEQKQKQREERQYREQRDKDPGRISASDWSHNILNLLNSRILRDIRNPIIFSCIWATFLSALYKSLISVGQSSNKSIADLALRAASSMVIPTTAHSVMVSAMSLLLVFRTNSAYQRFAEGRKIWEDIVSTSRDFSRMVKLYEFAIGTPKCRRIRQLIASFPYLLRHRIRPSLMQMKKVNDPSFVRDPENSLLLYPDVSMKDTDPEIAALAYDEEETGTSRRKTRELCWVDKRTLPWKLLPGTALDLCARAQNRPLWVVDRMAKELCVVEDVSPTFTNRERMALMAYTDKLSRSIGACERIHQTVVPLNYARHALRSVTVWLWTLPFALIKDLGLLTGPIIAIIAWILFGVYEIGTRIEDPFQGTLRLSIYCDAIRRDVLADAIVRDTAFDLDEESRNIEDTDGDEDAIFEFESDSDEYGEADASSKRSKGKTKKEKGWFKNQD